MEFMAIAKVGIELEGGWATRPTNGAWHTDGSVSIRYGTDGAVHIGEFVSAPLDSWQAVADWVAAAYPTTHNQTCGMHVHVSFRATSRTRAS